MITSFTALRRIGTFSAGLLLCAAAQAITVLSNNPTPGDSFTNAGPSGTGQAVGSSGWYYNNVRVSGQVGINTTYARSGNGSAFMTTPAVASPGTTNGKADIEFLPNASANSNGNFNPGASLGSFSAFAGMGYDWYRDASSTTSNVQHPSLRVLVATTGGLTGLVFERAYNSLPTPTNAWTTDNISSTTNLWSFGAVGFASGGYGVTLADWKSDSRLKDAVVVGFSSGVGSGWGGFTGAVDNINWTIGQVTTTSNFEVSPIPEPSTWAMMLAGLVGVGALARRRKV